MRTISSALETAQKAASRTPYVGLIFRNPAGGYVDYTSRKKLVEHHEEPYNDYATIILDNSDRAVVNLTGYHIQICYGDSGDCVQAARLWVKSQYNISMEGKLATVVTLEGAWSLMGEQLLRVGSPPLYNDQPYTTQTIYNLLRTLIETELAIATGFAFSLSSLADQDDGIINTFIPNFLLNQTKFDDFNTLIQVLMAMTHCYLRARTGLVFQIVYPQEDDAVDETYYSYQAHFFYEYAEQFNIVVPNHVIVFCNQQEEGWVAELIITGEAEDSDQIARYMEVIGLFTAPTITNQTDATNRAEAIMSKQKAEILSGRLIIPHDCRVELYDRVAVYDTRGA